MRLTIREVKYNARSSINIVINMISTVNQLGFYDILINIKSLNNDKI